MRPMIHTLRGVATLLAALVMTQSASAQNDKQPDAERPEIRVVGMVGEPMHIGPDKSEQLLQLGDRLDYGSRIQTGGEARAAITVRWSRDLPGEALDLVLLGPDGDITFMTNDALDNDAPSRAVVIRATKGVIRVVARAPGNASALYIKEGPRETRCVKTDVILETNPTVKSTSYYCRFGQVGIRHVSRLMMLNSGLMREIEKGELLGARRFASFQWEELANRTEVPDVETAFPSPTIGEEGEGGAPRVPKQPGRTAPPRSTTDSATAPTAKETREQSELEYARIVTSMGDIDLELNRAKAPVTVENFLTYVDEGFYDGTIFHRVISNFMIQGGGLTPNMQRKPTAPSITNEWRNGLKNVRGSIAMARQGGDPNSATSQFFINVVDNAGLDRPQPDGAAYAVFGRVIDGMEVVDKIRFVETTARSGRRDVPVETVLIKEIKRIDKPAEEGAESDSDSSTGGSGEGGE